MANTPILIVDDNPMNLKLLQILMTIEGYEVRTAMNANEALQILQNFQPTLILMDIQLPDMDGLELARKLKANPSYQNIIIIAITAYAMVGDNEKTLAAGCDGYISKPIDTQKLPQQIAAYLIRKKPL